MHFLGSCKNAQDNSWVVVKMHKAVQLMGY